MVRAMTRCASNFNGFGFSTKCIGYVPIQGAMDGLMDSWQELRSIREASQRRQQCTRLTWWVGSLWMNKSKKKDSVHSLRSSLFFDSSWTCQIVPEPKAEKKNKMIPWLCLWKWSGALSPGNRSSSKTSRTRENESQSERLESLLLRLLRFIGQQHHHHHHHHHQHEHNQHCFEHFLMHTPPDNFTANLTRRTRRRWGWVAQTRSSPSCSESPSGSSALEIHADDNNNDDDHHHHLEVRRHCLSTPPPRWRRTAFLSFGDGGARMKLAKASERMSSPTNERQEIAASVL